MNGDPYTTLDDWLADLSFGFPAATCTAAAAGPTDPALLVERLPWPELNEHRWDPTAPVAETLAAILDQSLGEAFIGSSRYRQLVLHQTAHPRRLVAHPGRGPARRPGSLADGDRGDAPAGVPVEPSDEGVTRTAPRHPAHRPLFDGCRLYLAATLLIAAAVGWWIH